MTREARGEGGRDERLARARERMLDLLQAHIQDERVLAAMAEVPRERFVPPDLAPYAYEDSALPIGYGQTISQPLMVAMMTEAIGPRPEDRVLEVGTGCGYQAAVLSRLVREVVTVERVAPLTERARQTLADLGYENVTVHQAVREMGWPEDAPYDAIVVTAGAPHVPRSLLGQLAKAGRMVIPVGPLRAQELVRVRKTDHGIELTRLGPCGFVPLIGEEAWGESAGRASDRASGE
ncbi:MAG TPA: protein-L-isoaspartate(D-aspartate) O-methyltransferase [Dehalococcoidia bacterium]|nr:protein-L-isoaspartate(D-aspartate) O-methyltransferase [Dehalococcoidia bacterium]